MGAAPEWNQFEDMSDSLPDLSGAESLVFEQADSGAGSAKAARSMLVDTLIPDYRDTSKGMLMGYHIRNTAFAEKTDTLWVLYNAEARDSLLGNETVLEIRGQTYYTMSKAMAWYRFLDADTNHFLDSAWVRKATPTLFGMRIESARATSGNDNDFTDPGRIRTNFLESLLLLGTDTLMLDQVADGDRDGRIYDTTRQSNVVDYIRIVQNPLFRPLLSRLQTWSRIRVTADQSRTERFASLRHFKDGRIVRVAIRGPNADSTFVGNGVAWVRARRISPRNSWADTITTTHAIRLASSPNDTGGHRLLYFSRLKVAEGDTIRGTEFAYVADSTAPSSAGPKGSLEFQARFFDGTSASGTGTVAMGVIGAVIVNRRGEELSIRWDLSGRVLD